jgi:hypothetical protein
MSQKFTGIIPQVSTYGSTTTYWQYAVSFQARGNNFRVEKRGTLMMRGETLLKRVSPRRLLVVSAMLNVETPCAPMRPTSFKVSCQ